MAFLLLQTAGLDGLNTLVDYAISENVGTLLPKLFLHTVNESQQGSLLTRLRQLIIIGTGDESLRQAKSITDTFDELLASTFHKHLEHPSLAALIVQELKNESLITEAEWKRLTILRMVLDGLDVEINEYGQKLRHEDLEKAIEYCEIIHAIMLRNQVEVGITSTSSNVATFAVWQLRYGKTFSSLSEWSLTSSE